jgi:Tfp pilus assembly protein FimV
VPPRLRLWLARLAAPAALLLAATVAVLLVRSAIDTAEEQTPTTATATTATEPAPPPPPRPRRRTGTGQAEAQFYTVQSGDTLATIADQYGTTVEELLLLNPDVDPIELSIGERIRVQ